ncbi:MAG: sulfur globule family protein [Myxococcales bacterium]|nr:sulfur globule family protein [Myxococcales bacterium]
MNPPPGPYGGYSPHGPAAYGAGPPYGAPYGAQYGGPGPAQPGASPMRGFAALGGASLAASLLLGLVIAYRAVATAMTVALDEIQRKLLGGKVPASVQHIADEVTGTMRRVATLELATLAPCALALFVLFILSILLLVKRRWAAKATMVWGGLTFFAVAATIAAQVLYLVPELRALERRIAQLTSAYAGAPQIAAPTLARTVVPAVFLLLWAIAAFAWAWYLDQRANGGARP